MVKAGKIRFVRDLINLEIQSGYAQPHITLFIDCVFKHDKFLVVHIYPLFTRK